MSKEANDAADDKGLKTQRGRRPVPKQQQEVGQVVKNVAEGIKHTAECAPKNSTRPNHPSARSGKQLETPSTRPGQPSKPAARQAAGQAKEAAAKIADAADEVRKEIQRAAEELEKVGRAAVQRSGPRTA